MGQRGMVAVLVVVLSLLSACDRGSSSAKRAIKRATTRPTVASLVPAATELILGLSAEDHLVGISNYDSKRYALSSFPRIGDYQNVDWEQLRAIKPDILITFHSPDRVPPGVKEKAAELNIRLVNVRTETLDDYYREILSLGDLLHEEKNAQMMEGAVRRSMERLKRETQPLPKVPTLIVIGETPTSVVGRDNFLNDLLEIAGGENVISRSGWPTIDREQLVKLNPQAIIQLLTGVEPRVEAAARDAWDKYPELDAVKHDRLRIFNGEANLKPGMRLPMMARSFAVYLHPDEIRMVPARTMPATTRGLP